MKIFRWKDDWTGFFLVYFQWCYYLCLTPFRFEWDAQRKEFKLARNPIQSMACVMQYTLLGIWYFKDLRKIPVDNLYKNPDVYFSIAFNLNAIYYHVFVLAIYVWRRQERFLAIINFDSGELSRSSVKNKILAVSLCFLFAFLPLFYTLSGYRVFVSTKHLDASLMFRCLVVEGRFAFFLSEASLIPCTSRNAPSYEEISIPDVILGVLAFLMETARQVVGFYSDFFPLICCISLWTCVGLLEEFLEKHYDDNEYSAKRRLLEERHDCKRDSKGNGQCNNGIITLSCISQAPPTPSSEILTGEKVASQCNEVGKGSISIETTGDEIGTTLLDRYEVCKAFAKRVNRALGQLLFAYVLSSIMYLSTCLDAVLVLEDWSGKLRVAFFFSIFIVMFFIGSEIVNKVYGLQQWLSVSANNAFLPEKDLMVLFQEITRKSVGVSGNGMFTITYSTFMTVVTTTVTFFIIILQFQKPGREHFSSVIWDNGRSNSSFR